MKTKVSLRTKPLATDRVRLYFDFYPPIVLPGKTKSTRRIFTDLFLYTQPKSPQEKEHNKEVKIQSDILLGKYSSFSSNYEFFSQADKNAFERKQREKQSFYSFFMSLLEYRTGETKRQWKTTLHCLERFHPGDILFSDITVEFVASFKKFLQTPAATKKNKKLHQNTSRNYFKPFRVTLNTAYKYEYLSKDFCKIVSDIKELESKKNVLTTDEIKRLIHTHCIDEEIKRASLFSIYTGLRHSDICLLTWKDFVQTETGISIDYRQKKTSNLELLPISKEAQELIGQIQADDILIFPTLITKKKHNDVIKEWMKQAEIRKHITFHCFRHTHGTLLFHKGASELTVGKLMGHRSQKTTRQYIKLMDYTKRNAVELLTFM